MDQERRLGAWPQPNGTHFAVWSDKASEVKIRWKHENAGHQGECPLTKRFSEPHLYEGFIDGLLPGTLYEVLVDGVSCVDPFARDSPSRRPRSGRSDGNAARAKRQTRDRVRARRSLL